VVVLVVAISGGTDARVVAEVVGANSYRAGLRVVIAVVYTPNSTVSAK
jgi:PP-loop superfamily ATP-utilizing enzyme